MPFEQVLGNEAALARLKGLLRHGRLAHAYLFSGPDGVGKKLVAVEFARALGANPVIVSRLEGKHETGIAQIQEIIRELNFVSRDRRVVIFDEADRMSEEAMNALLKTLEEPSEGTVLILVTSVPQRLIPTLRSRCQTILFFPMSDDEIARLAGDKTGVLALISGGSAGTALKLAGELDEVLATARELQERVLSGELNPLIEAFAKIRDTDQARRTAKRELSLLTLCLRDVLLSKAGVAPRLASPAFVERLGKLDEDELTDRLQILIDHERLIDLNANVTLTVADALLRV